VLLAGATVTTGRGFTVTVIVCVLEQPVVVFVPIMVYVVVDAGEAITVVPVVADKPVTGDQV
jgi:hypothetical protein